MKYLFFNLKGGQGKTFSALNTALTHGIPIITNDTYSPLESVLPQDVFIKLAEKDGIPDIVNQIPDVIFDFGGKEDKRLSSIVELVDFVVIPVIPEAFNDIQTTITTINTLLKIKANLRIVIVINAISSSIKKEAKEADLTFRELYPSADLISIRYSKACSEVWRTGDSIKDLASSGGLKWHSYKGISSDYENLFKLLKL